MNNTQVLNNQKNYDTMSQAADHIMVSRQDLEAEHRTLLQRLHQIRRLLGYTELQTGYKQRQHGNHIG